MSERKEEEKNKNAVLMKRKLFNQLLILVLSYDK
jgi:hypothetical protein